MTNIKYIDEIDIKEKRLFIRLDLNVPINEKGEVGDTTRIEAALPTIKYALDQNAKLILASHLGRPKGERKEKFSLRPVAEKLAEFLSKDVIFPEDCIGDGVRKLASELKPGEVMLLENLRFHKEEKDNDAIFAEKLASLADIYINDAFGTAHRAHASTEGITDYLTEKAGGFLIKRELEILGRILENPSRPFIAIIGGAKISDKLGVIENLMNKVESLIIGGAMAYTFLKAKGYGIGKSRYEEDMVHTAKKILDRASTREVDFLLPVDHIITKEVKENSSSENTEDENIPDDQMGVDIGEKSIKLFKNAISKASTIFWNGPMGIFETPPFDKGTHEIAEAVAESSSTSVIGGGDSVAAVKKMGLADKLSHICTGGGASLKFLEGKKLPGIEALKNS